MAAATVTRGRGRREGGEGAAAGLVHHRLGWAVERVAVAENEKNAQPDRLGSGHQRVVLTRYEVVHARRALDLRPVEIVANHPHARVGEPPQRRRVDTAARRAIVRVDGNRVAERRPQRGSRDQRQHAGEEGGVARERRGGRGAPRQRERHGCFR
jgi:hypothetical protein